MGFQLPMPSAAIAPSTWAVLKAVTPQNYTSSYATDAGVMGTSLIYFNGRWRPEGGISLLATYDTQSANIANSDTVVFQYLIPSGLIQLGDRIIWRELGLQKSGLTDSCVMNLRLGTAGTTSDTSIATATVMAAANLTFDAEVYFRLATATSLQQQAITTSPYALGGTSNNALAAAVTISSAASNALFASVSIRSNGVTNTVQEVGGQLYWVSTVN